MSFIGDAVSGLFGGGSAAEDAARIQQQGSERAIDVQSEQFQQILELLGPSIEGG